MGLPTQDRKISVEIGNASVRFKRYEICLSGEYHIMHEAVQTQLFQRLGLSAGATVQKLRQPGGRNLGVWLLHDMASGRHLIAKLVAEEFNEGDQFVRLASEWPCIVNDPLLAFPICIVREKRPSGAKAFDLIVMNPAAGAPLGDVIGMLWHSGQTARVMQIIEKAGACLAKFHARYGNRQHGDFQPS